MASWRRALAEFLGKEDCLVFSTGYQANLGLISGLIGRGELVYLDKLDHASIVDGAKMSYGDTLRFTHGDLAGPRPHDRAHQEQPGRDDRGGRRVLDGRRHRERSGAGAHRPKHGVALALDDAHSIGVLGPNGDGTAAHFGMTDDVDIIAGTFSKSLASIGGFVAGTENVIHFLKHHSRPLIFTASLPPSNTAGVLAALEVLQHRTAAA